MPAIAKLFQTGHSQAVRLPKEFRFRGTEVFIRRDPHTGNVVLSAKPDDWKSFFDLADRASVSADFLADRDNRPAEEREPL